MDYSETPKNVGARGGKGSAKGVHAHDEVSPTSCEEAVPEEVQCEA